MLNPIKAYFSFHDSLMQVFLVSKQLSLMWKFRDASFGSMTPTVSESSASS